MFKEVDIQNCCNYTLAPWVVVFLMYQLGKYFNGFIQINYRFWKKKLQESLGINWKVIEEKLEYNNFV